MIIDAGLGAGKPTNTSMDHNLKLTQIEYDETLNLSIDGSMFNNIELYRRLIGTLLYITMNRLDIAFF